MIERFVKELPGGIVIGHSQRDVDHLARELERRDQRKKKRDALYPGEHLAERKDLMLRFQEGIYQMTIAARGAANPAGPGLAITFSMGGQFLALNHEEVGAWIAKLEPLCALPAVEGVALPWGPHEHQKAMITAGDACKLAAMLRALPPSIRSGRIVAKQ